MRERERARDKQGHILAHHLNRGLCVCVCERERERERERETGSHHSGVYSVSEIVLKGVVDCDFIFLTLVSV